MPELARGKTGRVLGHLVGLITLMKGQPLAYNKDNQEDKEPLFDTVDTLRDTLRIFAEMVAGIVVKPEAMERAARRGYATATDLADYLVKKGLPFRDAHEVVAHAVKLCLERGIDLVDLPLAELRALNATDRRRRLRRLEPARLARRARRDRRHGAGTGTRTDRAPSRTARLTRCVALHAGTRLA